jgi:hypothetical protein
MAPPRSGLPWTCPCTLHPHGSPTHSSRPRPPCHSALPPCLVNILRPPVRPPTASGPASRLRTLRGHLYPRGHQSTANHHTHMALAIGPD